MGTLILFGILIAIVVAAIIAIQFPEMATTVISYIDIAFQYIKSGMGIVWLFVQRDTAVVLLGLVVAIEVIYRGYLVVMWVLRKIPTAGVD